MLLITAEDTSADQPTLSIIQRYYPDAEIRAELPGYAAMLSGKRAERLLGFQPQYRCHQ